MNKYYNTMKMMGVPARQALDFADSLECYHLCVGQSLKQRYLDIMFGTVVMGKTMLEWMNGYREKEGVEPFEPIAGIIETSSIKALVELVLQEYYKKEFHTMLPKMVEQGVFG